MYNEHTYKIILHIAARKKTRARVQDGFELIIIPFSTARDLEIDLKLKTLQCTQLFLAWLYLA